MCPDFNQPDFPTLTLTRMLEQLGEALTRVQAPVTLMGSSLGGTLAVLAADDSRADVDRLVLLAPAVMFAKPGHHLLPPERVDEWRRRGALPFFHYASTKSGCSTSVLRGQPRYDAFGADALQPTLIFQGLRDASVDYRTVERSPTRRPNVTLSLLDDDQAIR